MLLLWYRVLTLELFFDLADSPPVLEAILGTPRACYFYGTVARSSQRQDANLEIIARVDGVVLIDVLAVTSDLRGLLLASLRTYRLWVLAFLVSTTLPACFILLGAACR